MSLKIREVVVEILRHGEPHNQLLSPLTRYLVLCGSHPAEQLTVPFEHRELQFRLSRMRYRGGVTSDGAGDRLFAQSELAATVTGLFEQIPSLPHVGRVGEGELLHLRLMITPQELALLPFELANPPGGFGSSAQPLLLGPEPDVVLTREVRRAETIRVQVPPRPRILLAVASPTGKVPHEATEKAIVDALLPWAQPTERDGQVRANLDAQLVVLPRASLDEIREQCATGRFTHVHILAHGDELSRPGQEGFGLVLWDRRKEVGEVIDGPTLARALRPPQDDSSWAHPWCVLLCTCESGDIGSVVHPSASLAHSLHVAGIPLVLASQYPLTFRAATILTREFYPLELRGEDPRRTIRDVRHAIASQVRETHDWASLVVYAGLPDDVGAQLDSMRVVRTFAQLEAAQDWADRVINRSDRGDEVGARVRERSIQLIENVIVKLRDEAVLNEARRTDIKREVELNEVGKHEREHRIASVTALLTEIYGLLGSAEKRRARLLAVHGSERASHEALRESAKWYLRGAGLKAPEHWTACQSFVMMGISGTGSGASPAAEQWRTALETATHALEDPSSAVWAYGTLIEVEIWRPIFDQDADPGNARDKAVAYFGELRAAVGDTAFPVMSTTRQLARYRDWWGPAGYLDEGVLERASAVLVGAPGPDPDLGEGEALEIDIPQSAESIELRESDEVLGSGQVTPVAVVEAPADSFYRIEMLPARQGDALWVEYGTGDDVSRLLIDGGFRTTIRTVDQRIEEVAASSPDGRCHFELGVVSHIDADHIEGFIEILASQRPVSFDDLWFNGRRHLNVPPVESVDEHGVLGGKHGMFLDQMIEVRKPKWNIAFGGSEVVVPSGSDPPPVHVLPGGMKLTLMSPTITKLHLLSTKWDREVKDAGLAGASLSEIRAAMDRLHYSDDVFEDTLLGRKKPHGPLDIDALLREPDGVDGTAANGSSIAFVAEFEGRSCLLAADAHPDVLIDSIDRLVGPGNRLRVGVVKLPHHGSGNNVTLDLLKRIDSNVFLISTNGGGGHYHPDRQAIAKLVAGAWRPDGDDEPIRLLFNYRSEYTEIWDDQDLMDRYGYQVDYADSGDILQLTAVPPTPGS